MITLDKLIQKLFAPPFEIIFTGQNKTVKKKLSIYAAKHILSFLNLSSPIMYEELWIT